nr:DUF2195 family protein [Massilia sp. MS-15]
MLGTFSSLALNARAEQITFANELAACVTIKTITTSTASNMVVASTNIQLRKSIGECGCLSALAVYISSVDRGGVQQILQEGLIRLDSDGEKNLVLATEPRLLENKAVQVRLVCAPPL